MGKTFYKTFVIFFRATYPALIHRTFELSRALPSTLTAQFSIMEMISKWLQIIR